MLTESHPTDPISSYGITKLALEKYLALYRHLHGLDYRILRISNAYGEGQQPDRPQDPIGVVLRRIAAGSQPKSGATGRWSATTSTPATLSKVVYERPGPP